MIIAAIPGAGDLKMEAGSFADAAEHPVAMLADAYRQGVSDYLDALSAMTPSGG